MSDILTLENEIYQMFDSLSQDLEKLDKKDPSQNLKQANRCHNKLGEIKVRIEAYELEVLQLDRFSQPQYKEKLKDFQNQLKEMKGEFERKKRSNSEADTGLEDFTKNLDEMTGQELIKLGDQYQEKGTTALHRIIVNIESANQKADEVNVEIFRQEEQIQKTKDKTKDVQSEIKKAGAYLRYFARQIYTDKILSCFVILCIIAIIVIIILKIVRKERLPTVQDVVDAVKKK